MEPAAIGMRRYQFLVAHTDRTAMGMLVHYRLPKVVNRYRERPGCPESAG